MDNANATTDWLGGNFGVAVESFNIGFAEERRSLAKGAAKRADKALRAAGFVKQASEKRHTPSQKMGRSEAYSGSSDKRETTYAHPDGRTCRMIERHMKYGQSSVAVHQNR